MITRVAGKQVAAASSIGYCTNVHAGHGLAGMRESLEKYAVQVREKFAPTQMMGVGLWMSAPVAQQLRETDGVAEFRTWLRENGLKPYTVNGFPYGDFHQPVVKHEVYKPTWWDRERLDYTCLLADILDELLEPGEYGSISTLPLGWPTPEVGDEQLQIAGEHLRTVARHLAGIEQRTGRLMSVCIEPEPGCLLDEATDMVEFFQTYLLGSADDDLVRRHLRICHDVCHSAVMFEPQREAFRLYRDAGIEVGKMQVSSAVILDFDRLAGGEREAALEQLAAFHEPRYLHQTTVMREGKRVLYTDLAEAIAAERHNLTGCWRTHFHVPIFLPCFGYLSTSQSDIREALTAAREMSTCEHFEVETYAWGVLPDELRRGALADGIADELRWLAANRG